MNTSASNAFINGDLIDLLPINLNHVDLYDKWGNDQEVRHLRHYEFPRSMDEIKERYLNSIKATDKYSFEVVLKEDDVPIGTCNLHEINWVSRTAEIGFFIGEKKYWGKGLGTEIASLITKYAFQELNLRKLKAVIYSPNLGSQKVFTKLDFHLEATLKGEEYIDGKYIDILFYVKYRNENEK
ncbi:hypothetical protein NEF87_001860 [Candidatus Lokiarchaeum ossiferum]|uniref:N-acetyltransferase domain-containing protein n=1 Tax=Candidatus Lokiarchaeum ossiferum TaxID=2951803 RepID=A0ABY6HQ93_9ARCH|nr:hypothetical protein NEF87_001860 [Candidatus Lokiarchaeum sp. B-35]